MNLGLIPKAATLLARMPPWMASAALSLFQFRCRSLPRWIDSPLIQGLVAQYVARAGIGHIRSSVKTEYGAIIEIPREETELYLFGSKERHNSRFFKAVIPHANLFVNVGANIGYYVLLAARWLPTHAQIWAYEPAPATYGLLCRNIHSNNVQRIMARQIAISNRSGRMELLVPSADGIAELAGGTIVSNYVDEVSVTVETRTLDEELQGVSSPGALVVLMDIEGAEVDAIGGMARTLRALRPLLLLEVHPALLSSLGYRPDDVLALLEKADYECFIVSQSGRGLNRASVNSLGQLTSAPRWVVALPRNDDTWQTLFEEFAPNGG